MRVNTDSDDAVGYINWVLRRPLRVFLNNQPMKYVVFADEQLGEIVMHEIGMKGEPLLNEDRSACRLLTLRGTVRLEEIRE